MKNKLKGTIVSDKMDKTIVVEVTSLRRHPKYHKFVRTTKNYKAHDKENEYKTGDKVIIESSRPLSKDKKWVVVSKA